MHFPQTKPLEDPQNQLDAPPANPWRMAMRNALLALAAAFGAAGGHWLLAVHNGGKTYWWIWGALAVFVVAICFAHAFVAIRFGARRAAIFFKAVIVIALAAMLLGVWWYLQPK